MNEIKRLKEFFKDKEMIIGFSMIVTCLLNLIEAIIILNYLGESATSLQEFVCFSRIFVPIFGAWYMYGEMETEEEEERKRLKELKDVTEDHREVLDGVRSLHV